MEGWIKRGVNANRAEWGRSAAAAEKLEASLDKKKHLGAEGPLREWVQDILHLSHKTKQRVSLNSWAQMMTLNVWCQLGFVAIYRSYLRNGKE